MSKMLDKPEFPQIAAALAARNMTQADLARQIGERPDTISKIQQGRLKLPARVAVQLEKALGIHLTPTAAPRKPRSKAFVGNVGAITNLLKPQADPVAHISEMHRKQATAVIESHTNGYDVSGLQRLLDQLHAAKERTETQIQAASDLLEMMGHTPSASTQPVHMGLDSSMQVDDALILIAKNNGGNISVRDAAEEIYRYGVGGYPDARTALASMYYFVKKSGAFVKTGPGEFRLA